jgi:translation initiation factor 2 subunit 3
VKNLPEKKSEVNPKMIPECNIGMVGHVSHGKCILPTDFVLLNQNVIQGKDLLNLAKEFDDEILLDKKLRTFSVDSDANLKSSDSYPFFQKYDGKLIKIVTKNGREVNLSPEHPLLVNRGDKIEWAAAKDLEVGDEIFVLGKIQLDENMKIAGQIIKPDEVFRNAGYKIRKNGGWIILKTRNNKIMRLKEMDVDENFVRLIAFVNAEGSLHRKMLRLTQKEEKKLLSIILKYLRRIGCRWKLYKHQDYCVSPKLLGIYLFEILGGAKKIKNWILYLPRNLKREYLKWLFSLDGAINLKAKSIELTQKSKYLTNVILLLLLNFGIFPAIYKKKVKENEYYRITLNGNEARKFLEKIGFVGNKEQEGKNFLRILKKTKRVKDYSEVTLPSYLLKILLKIFVNERTGGVKGLKHRSWYLGLREAKKRGRFTYAFLENFLDECKKEIENLNKMGESELIGRLPLRKIARLNGMSYSSFYRYVKQNDARVLAMISEYKERLVEEATEAIEKIERLYLSSLRVEKIKKKEEFDYKGIIFDLSVPQTHTFFGGLGYILLHNTTLTQALTGRLTLTHSEELKRGITIRLGYADATIYKCLECGKYSTSKKCPYCFSDAEIQRTVSFVDAPGHETLMATVLTGASLMDGALLIIAANEKCPQPQTREHLTALEVVGIKNVIVVQNKIDLVTEEQAMKNYEEIKKFIKGTSIENSPVIPVSAQQRINIDAVLEAIEKLIPTPSRDSSKDPLMLVARSFDINKPGTEPKKLAGGVLGGAIVSGILRLGDEIEIRPGVKIGNGYQPLVTEVVGLQKAGIDLEEAGPGGLLGLMTKLDPCLTKSDALVGNVVGLVGRLPEVRETLDLRIELLDRVVGTDEMSATAPIKVGENLLINVGTARSIGTVTAVKTDRIELKLKIPICVEKRERIVISRQVAGRWRLVGYGTNF